MPVNPFTVIGMGTRKYQQDNVPVKECGETLSKTGCGCCVINPCDICLEWEVYGETLKTGEAVDTGTEWVGMAGGITFVAGWDPYTCTFSVTLNGEEVFSAVLCGKYGEETVTCRDWDNEVAYTRNAGEYGEESGIFRWARKDNLQLLKRKGDPPEGTYHCARHFCGDCLCIPRKLCVSVTNITSLDSCEGTVEFDGDLCEDMAVTASWSGTLVCDPSGSLAVAFELQRNQYTDACELTGTASGSLGADSIDWAFEPEQIVDCLTLSTVFTFTDGYDEFQVVVRSLDCGSCEPEICIECCDSIPPSPPATLIVRISLGTIDNPDPETPVDTSCWTDLEFAISFLYDVDEDAENVCTNQGSTRRADCVGNLLDREFDPSCCSGGQWIGGGSNGCGDIDICFIPCASGTACPPPPPGKTYAKWRANMSVGGGGCDFGTNCLICHDEIAFSAEAYEVCASQLFTVGTATVRLIVDISES